MRRSRRSTTTTMFVDNKEDEDLDVAGVKVITAKEAYVNIWWVIGNSDDHKGKGMDGGVGDRPVVYVDI